MKDEIEGKTTEQQQSLNEKEDVSHKKKKALAKAKKERAKKLKKGGNADEDEEEKVPEGLMPYEIGPDGVPLRRNYSDVMNNFQIDIVARSYTDIELSL